MTDDGEMPIILLLMEKYGTTRRCNVCGEEKPIGEFPLVKRKRGIGSAPRAYCKPCHAVASADYDARHRQHVLSRKRAYGAAHSDQRKEKMRTWYQANRDAVLLKEKARHSTPKGKVRRVVIDAVRRGRIQKPNCCEICGTEPGKMHLHAHHADYSKPLEVVWLCRLCHAKAGRSGAWAASPAEAICLAAAETLAVGGKP